MKTPKANLSLETLEDRSLLSASPWGEFAPQAPPMPRAHGFQTPIETTTLISLAPSGAAATILGHTTVSNPSWTAARQTESAMAELNRKTLQNGNMAEPSATVQKLKDIWGGAGSESAVNIPAQIIARATPTSTSGVINNVFTPWTARMPGNSADQDGFTVIVVTDHGQAGR